MSDGRPVALITGGATGVGRACAIRFGGRGYDVIVNYLGPEKDEATETLKAIPDDSIMFACDVSNDEAVREMAATIEQRFGRLDVVVNCAATTHFVAHADLDGMSEEKWDEIMAVNTKGPFFVTRACRAMLQMSKGSIVNVSSVAGISGFGSSVAYCASKGALNTMTKSLARALAPHIRVNAVCPGPIDSDWLRRGMNEEEIRQRVESFPIPQLAQPEDIVDGVEYLATGTSLTTGQLLVIDGGRTM